jgi:hypothetical protein
MGLIPYLIPYSRLTCCGYRSCTGRVSGPQWWSTFRDDWILLFRGEHIYYMFRVTNYADCLAELRKYAPELPTRHLDDRHFERSTYPATVRLVDQLLLRYRS